MDIIIQYKLYLGALIMMLLVVHVVYLNTRRPTYHLEDYFLRIAAKNQKDFMYAKLEPLMSGNYMLSLYFKKSTLVYKKRYGDLYGAKIDGIQRDICSDLNLPKDSMSNRVVNMDEIIFERKGEANG